MTTVAGHLAESVTGAVIAPTITGLDLAHFPERHGEPEVDFILTIGIKRIPVEVKYQARIDPLRDTEGLRVVYRKSREQRAIRVSRSRRTIHLKFVDPRVISLPLSSLMLLR